MIFDSSSEYRLHSAKKFVWDNTSVDHRDPPRKKHGIVLVNGGSFTFNLGDSSLTAQAGDMLYLPQNSCYTDEIENGDAYLINFENDRLSFDRPVRLISECKNKYQSLFDRIIDLRIRGESEFLVKSQFYLLLDNITKDMYSAENENPFLKNVKTLLESDENYSVKEIAKRCAISESGLRKLFKSTYGISPIEYKQKIKINKAKFLLEGSTLSIAEISEQLGFYDAAYFTKAFKHHAGCTPTEYIKQKAL